MRFIATIVAFLFLTMSAWGEIPIPLCPIEGLNVFMVNPLSVTGTNCQPKASNPEFMIARCWTRDPDALIPAYATECHCFENTSDFSPALIPGNYSIASSSCPAGVAAVLTSMVKHRGWAADAGCDDPGNLCPVESAQAAFLPRLRFSAASVTKQRCHVFSSGRQKCKDVE